VLLPIISFYITNKALSTTHFLTARKREILIIHIYSWNRILQNNAIILPFLQSFRSTCSRVSTFRNRNMDAVMRVLIELLPLFFRYHIEERRYQVVYFRGERMIVSPCAKGLYFCHIIKN